MPLFDCLKSERKARACRSTPPSASEKRRRCTTAMMKDPSEELQRRKSNSALAPRQRVLRAVGDTNHAPGSKLLACVAADVGNHSLFLRFDQVSIDCLCTWRKNASCTCGQVIDQWERAEGRDGLPNV